VLEEAVFHNVNECEYVSLKLVFHTKMNEAACWGCDTILY